MEEQNFARLVRQESLVRPAATAERFVANIETVVRDKREEIELVLSAMISGGHVLFEDVPGTAKTVLARAIAQSIEGATTSRIQCTPDLQPADVTGLSVFNQKERDFEFRAGPVFAHVLLPATENPTDKEGTFFPPEAQLDRFFVRTALA